jgi:hypothetical protein
VVSASHRPLTILLRSDKYLRVTLKMHI